MSGHVFVVHGDLLKISADVLLIPCDASGEVLRHWGPYGPAPDQDQLADQLRLSRVSAATTVEDQPLRYVDTGAQSSTADATWLGDGLRIALQAAVGDASERVAKHRRARSIVAMPLFGVGEGGFDAVRGAALRAQLTAARGVANECDIDIMIVCFERSDFAAVQRERTASFWELPQELQSHAESLAAAIRSERLVLFLGAGVSAAAGIDDFAGLVVELEKRAGVTDTDQPESKDFPARIAALRADKTWINEEVAELVSKDQYSLTHGLLASLRVRESITTNFDRLYELSCIRPFIDTPLEVLPWQRTAGRNPWLLKAHGDPLERGPLVFDTPSFDSFETDRASSAGVVRAMLTLSREVLFVGYALKDKNIEKLVHEADTAHREIGVANSRLGTIVDIESAEINLGENPVRIGIQSSPGASVAASALRLQVWLDLLLWLTTKDEASWLLDERYAALHDTDEERNAAKRLAAEQLPSSGNWPVVQRRLQQFGRRQTDTDTRSTNELTEEKS